MVQVVGQDQSVTKRITHSVCGAILEYRPHEVRPLWEGKDYGGGPAGATGFTCPQCGKEVITGELVMTSKQVPHEYGPAMAAIGWHSEESEYRKGEWDHLSIVQVVRIRLQREKEGKHAAR